MKFEILSDRRARLADAVVGFEIDLFVFHRSPETFDEDVVAPCAFSIHADLDLLVEENLGKVMAGGLAIPGPSADSEASRPHIPK